MAGGMAGSLQGLYVTIQFQTAGVGAVHSANAQLNSTTASAKKAKTQLGGLTEILNRSHVAFASLTFMMNRLAREFNRGFTDSVDNVLSFQESISDVQRTTELTGRSLESIKNSILRVSSETGQAATDVSTIYRELGRQSSLLANLTESELVRAYDVLGEKFAKFVGVGDVTLEFAMEKVPRIANLFKRDFGGVITNAMTGVMDIMSALSHSIAGTSEDIIYYSSLMAAGAERFGWSIHETAAMSSMFIELNKRAQRSGSAFQKMFNTMTDQSVNNMLKARTGIEATHEELIAAVLGYSDLETFRRVIQTPEQAIDMLFELRDRVVMIAERTPLLPEQVMALLGFGGVRLQDITGSMLKRERFENRFRDLVEISKDSAGDVEQRFSVFMLNVKKQWERMRNIIKNTITATYQEVADALTPIIQKMNAFLLLYMKANPQVVQFVLTLSFAASLFFTLGTILSGVLFLISMFGKSLILAGIIMSGVVAVFVVGAAVAWAAWEKYEHEFMRMLTNLSKNSDRFIDQIKNQDDRIKNLMEGYKEFGRVVLDNIEFIVKYLIAAKDIIKFSFIDPIYNTIMAVKTLAVSIIGVFTTIIMETSVLASFLSGISGALYVISWIFQSIAWLVSKIIAPVVEWLAKFFDMVLVLRAIAYWIGFYLTMLIAIKTATLAYAALKALLLPFVFIWQAIAFWTNADNLALIKKIALYLLLAAYTIIVWTLGAAWFALSMVITAATFAVSLFLNAKGGLTIMGIVVNVLVATWVFLKAVILSAAAALGLHTGQTSAIAVMNGLLVAMKATWASINGLILLANGNLLLIPLLVIGIFVLVLWLTIKFTELVGLTKDWWKDLDRIVNKLTDINMSQIVDQTREWLRYLGEALTTWRGIAKAALYTNPVTLGMMVTSGQDARMFLGPNPVATRSTSSVGISNNRTADSVAATANAGNAVARIPNMSNVEGRLFEQRIMKVMEARKKRLAELNRLSPSDYETVTRFSPASEIEQGEIILPITVELDGQILYQVVEGVRLREGRGRGDSPLYTDPDVRSRR